jgi:uncharacterized repeat protein (TIGR03806 family)
MSPPSRWLVVATLSAALAAACSQDKDEPPPAAPACQPPDGIVDLATARKIAPTLDRLCLVAPTAQGEVVPIGASLSYDLASPLFSDYLLKSRTVYVPPGQQATYSADDVFTFPVGSAFTKTFAYADDLRAPGERRHLIETRVMLFTGKGWLSLPYLWNDEGTEARLSVGGTIKPLSFLREDGSPLSMNYLVPNANQCIKCHEDQERSELIGPKARNLNHDVAYPEGTENQLAHWTRRGILAGAPDPASAPRLAAWDDPSETLERRARSWIEINCAHCHSERGSARTSGLFLWAHEENPVSLGICKSPVAAGAGAGSFLYDIVPGKADQSILVYRMLSTDPAIMMPELGRAVVHAEGVKLVEDWINQLPGGCPP